MTWTTWSSVAVWSVNESGIRRGPTIAPTRTPAAPNIPATSAEMTVRLHCVNPGRECSSLYTIIPEYQVHWGHFLFDRLDFRPLVAPCLENIRARMCRS